jgi:hypothetical protein
MYRCMLPTVLLLLLEGLCNYLINTGHLEPALAPPPTTDIIDTLIDSYALTILLLIYLCTKVCERESAGN